MQLSFITCLLSFLKKFPHFYSCLPCATMYYFASICSSQNVFQKCKPDHIIPFLNNPLHYPLCLHPYPISLPLYSLMLYFHCGPDLMKSLSLFKLSCSFVIGKIRTKMYGSENPLRYLLLCGCKASSVTSFFLEESKTGFRDQWCYLVACDLRKAT
jgi:hypothetical protein